MPTKLSSALRLLSLRERDCLRLLQTGLQTPQVAANLGISLSTLSKHLTSARRKLGVRRTAQALLLFQDQDDVGHQVEPSQTKAIEEIAAESALLCGFIDALDGCRTFEDAWAVFQIHARQLGAPYQTCGVVAEPPGQLTNGAKILRYCFPDDINKMYQEVGGVEVDPIVPYVVRNKRGMLVDNELLARSLAGQIPRQVLALGEAAIDHGCRFMLLQPERDDVTGAPFAVCFVLEYQLAREIRGKQAPVLTHLRLMVRLFFDFLQRNQLLSEFSGLTNRQRQALILAARGFTIAESAEHMGVSTRSAEKTLALARDRLGAKTTPAAVYRAMVYRAIV